MNMIMSLSTKRQFMYIQGQIMNLEVWIPIFNPAEDSPIVPIWVVILELPWHFYCMKILRGLLSPIGKALHLDLASFQKIRGSVAKVKMQIDLTKSRPHHVWFEFDYKQDENRDGQWLEVQYENIPEYCLYCKHLAHNIQDCPVRQKDEENKKNKNNPESTRKYQISKTILKTNQ
ncbi:uncharacterized protein [Nicotiana tomentosiformis]|uniref:uncharacterized protein n=1 Tax=Nicotiana tomentosiformis TaxID=4098 RepID=UPI00051AF8FA|nr:uncharacterized protein LOC104106604 [Nicotiana tomentosiformis]